jgi:hypothetical protein
MAVPTRRPIPAVNAPFIREAEAKKATDPTAYELPATMDPPTIPIAKVVPIVACLSFLI